VTTRFLIIAAMMVVAALACVLVPMLRSARREGRPRAPFWLAIALALLMPPAVLGAYLALGTPQALQPVPTPGPADLAKAAAQLRASLAKKPDDAQGWTLLSQAYSALNQPQLAMDALHHVLRLKPDDPDAIVAYVEASAETSPTHKIDDAARGMLQHALQVKPTHQRALWLLGISDFQRQQYAGAMKQWNTLLPLLPEGSNVAAAVKQELAEAEARMGAGSNTPNPGTTTTGTPAAATRAVALTVNVKLDPNIATKVQPGDTLFVFARAVDGPRMPLAVARIKASTLPARVTLTDAMAMTPQLKLSNYREVQVLARISKSGNAMPAAGDLESAATEVATNSRKPVSLTINRVD
jgi:cytochrome c-type biogenesis protein CcmH